LLLRKSVKGITFFGEGLSYISWICCRQYDIVGRRGVSWVRLLKVLSLNKRITLLFFDTVKIANMYVFWTEKPFTVFMINVLDRRLLLSRFILLYYFTELVFLCTLLAAVNYELITVFNIHTKKSTIYIMH
jgi:hypothetical protein